MSDFDMDIDDDKVQVQFSDYLNCSIDQLHLMILTLTEWVDQVKRWESCTKKTTCPDILEKTPLMADIRCEIADIERFSVINRFARFHSKGPVDNNSGNPLQSSLLKPIPVRYIILFLIVVIKLKTLFRAHPWIQNAKKAPNVTLGDIVRSRLKQFSMMNRFKKKVLQVIAEHLSIQEVEVIKDMFSLMDDDDDGKITYQKLKAGLQKVGS